MTHARPFARVALVWRGDAGQPPPAPTETRFRRIFEEFEAIGVAAEPVVYAEEASERIRERLGRMDAVLVWVDPVVNGRERTQLDGLLREIAGSGVFVSTHPDIIQVMGTKRVLYDTRTMGWGADTDVVRDADGLSGRLRERLRSGPQVVKQDRGSSGNGVWRVELVREATPFAGATVRVQGAERGAIAADVSFRDFIAAREPWFAAFGGSGCFVLQPWAARLADGMVRCYMVQDRVAGFGHQFVTALVPAEAGARAPDPPPRYYFGPDKPEFQRLRALLEGGWLAEMQAVLGIDAPSLPMIWDADFLLGPREANGSDTYILCEVNVSGVFPIPDESIPALVRATRGRIEANRLR
jgi:hypothetical protein